LIQTLEALNLYGTKILPVHILAFYQALHRQHYPTLADFVNNYYLNERNAQIEHPNRGQKNNFVTSDEYVESTTELIAAPATSTIAVTRHPPQLPLKNRVSNKKNLNRMQLPKALLDFLQTTDQYVTLTSTVVRHKTSADQTTTKLMIQLHDEQIIESVIMRYTRPNKGDQEKSKTGYGNGRASLCVSSQCGCAMGCTVKYIRHDMYTFWRIPISLTSDFAAISLHFFT
jgi:sorting nexin-8